MVASSSSHMNTTKILQRIQTVARSRKPGQPSQPGSYDEALIEARRDLGNQAHMKRPLVFNISPC